MVVLSDKGGCAAKLYLESKDITFSESTKATGWIIKESRPKGISSSKVSGVNVEDSGFGFYVSFS